MAIAQCVFDPSIGVGCLGQLRIFRIGYRNRLETQTGKGHGGTYILHTRALFTTDYLNGTVGSNYILMNITAPA